MSRRRRGNLEPNNGPGYVRLWRGLIEHLPHFAENPTALIVYNWALLTRDHRDGTFLADFRDISNQTGLSQSRIKRSISWLRHGRGCDHCPKCADLGTEEHPSYIELVKAAVGHRPAVYRIRKDDSGRQKLPHFRFYFKTYHFADEGHTQHDRKSPQTE